MRIARHLYTHDRQRVSSISHPSVCRTVLQRFLFGHQFFFPNYSQQIQLVSNFENLHTKVANMYSLHVHNGILFPATMVYCVINLLGDMIVEFPQLFPELHFI